jgi:YgiT-type zinc finger domain-containing protein
MNIQNIYGDCHYCGGEIEEQQTKVDFWWEGKLFLIEDVPAGVCKQCGEKFFKANVSDAMDKLVKSEAVERILQIPVKRFKEAFAV